MADVYEVTTTVGRGAPGADLPDPHVADLAESVSVADQVERGDTDIDDMAVRRLFRATGSLAGARPKANVRILRANRPTPAPSCG